MPKRGGNISLTSYDDIFETDESRAESQLERVQNISISELVPFKDHPFKVVDDEAMLRTTESIAQYGVLTPLIARPLEGGYEIISGHRRAHAAELAGLTEVPVLVRQMDDDAATVLMVDSNLQRENILPSERALFPSKGKIRPVLSACPLWRTAIPRQICELISSDSRNTSREKNATTIQMPAPSIVSLISKASYRTKVPDINAGHRFIT